MVSKKDSKILYMASTVQTKTMVKSMILACGEKCPF